MAQAIGDILTPALGVALSPFPIVAVIIMLTSGRGRAKGIAFAVGWMAGLAALVGILLVVADRFDIEPGDDGPSTSTSIIRLLLGVGLLVLASRKWTSRPRTGETPAMPAWMASIERAGPTRGVAFGFGLSGLNPKNLMFNVIAGTAIASSGASPRGEVIVWIAYILLASATVIGPVAWYLVAPATGATRLDPLRRWLVRNSSVMVGMLLLIIGFSQIGDGIAGLG